MLTVETALRLAHSPPPFLTLPCRHPSRLLFQVVEFGKFEMDTWYYSPFPEPYASSHKLYICEYSLKYFRKKATLLRHLAKLKERHPPGDEIYRSPPPPTNNPGYLGGAVANPPIAVFEVRLHVPPARTLAGSQARRLNLWCQEGWSAPPTQRAGLYMRAQHMRGKARRTFLRPATV